MPIARYFDEPPVYRLFEPFGSKCWFRDHICTSKLKDWYKPGQLLKPAIQLGESGISKIERLLSRVTVFSKEKPVPTDAVSDTLLDKSTDAKTPEKITFLDGIDKSKAKVESKANLPIVPNVAPATPERTAYTT